MAKFAENTPAQLRIIAWTLSIVKYFCQMGFKNFSEHLLLIFIYFPAFLYRFPPLPKEQSNTPLCSNGFFSKKQAAANAAAFFCAKMFVLPKKKMPL
jgi:hypothetical protein